MLSESLALDEEFLYPAGIRGTRSHIVENVRAGVRRVNGALNLQPTAVEWSNLLNWIYGGTPVGTSYPLGETVPSRFVVVDRVSKVFTYSGVYVDSAVIKGSQGALLDLTLNLMGTDESVGNAGSFPSLTLDTTTAPFTFMDCVISIGGSNYQAKEFTLEIRNMIDGERFLNSLTRTALVAQDREISFSANLPYGDATAVYASGTAGVAVTITATNGAVSILWSLVKVCFPRKSPVVQGKQEIMLVHGGRALKSGSTLELATTLDSTP